MPLRNDHQQLLESSSSSLKHDDNNLAVWSRKKLSFSPLKEKFDQERFEYPFMRYNFEYQAWKELQTDGNIRRMKIDEGKLIHIYACISRFLSNYDIYIHIFFFFHLSYLKLLIIFELFYKSILRKKIFNFVGFK